MPVPVSPPAAQKTVRNPVEDFSRSPARPQHETDHLRDRLIEFPRYLLVEFNPTEGLGQHWISLDRDAVLPGDLEDSFGDRPAPLGHDDRRCLRPRLVVERNGNGSLRPAVHDTLSSS